MRARVLAAIVACSLSFAALASWAARTQTGGVFNLPFDPWSSLYVIGFNGGDGEVVVDGGTMISEQAIAIGGLAGDEGTLTVTGTDSRIDVDGDPTNRSPNVSCANGGTCVLEVLEGGAISINGAGSQEGDVPSAGMQVGFGVGAVGTARISGAGSFLGVENGAGDASGIAVGTEGDGQLVVEDGASIAIDTGTGSNGGVQIGGSGTPGQDTGIGLVTLTGAGTSLEMVGVNTSYSIGSSALGTLEVLDGATSTTQVGFVGLFAGSDGTVHIGSGATLNLRGENADNNLAAQLLVGLEGAGTLEVTDGTLSIDGEASTLFSGLAVGGAGGGPFTGGTGTATVSGPDALVDIAGPTSFLSIGPDGTGALVVEDGASVVVENPDDASGTSVGFQAGGHGTVDVSGTDSVLDAGVGMSLGIDLALADAGSAHVTVRDGGLLLTGSGGVAMGSDAVLGGDGTVGTGSGVFNFRGRVEAGAPIGVLDVTGTYEQSEATATTRFALADAGHSHLHATDAVDLLAGTLEVDLVGGFLPAAGDEFVLAGSNTSLSLDPAVALAVSGAADGFDTELTTNATQVILRALNDAQGLGGCQAGQLKALGTLCKQVFACESKRAKKPTKDADASGKEACLLKANAKFDGAWGKTSTKAAKKGDVCGIDDTTPAADVAARLVRDPAMELVIAILTGWDETAANKDDDKLRSSLLKEAGGFCSKLLSADSKQMKKRSDAKRDKAREKARTKFEGKVQKAIQKASGKGVDYTGPEPATLADDTEAVVADATTASASGLDQAAD